VAMRKVAGILRVGCPDPILRIRIIDKLELARNVGTIHVFKGRVIQTRAEQ